MKPHKKVIGTPQHHVKHLQPVKAATRGGAPALSPADPNKGLTPSNMPREDDGKGKTAETALQEKLSRGGPQK